MLFHSPQAIKVPVRGKLSAGVIFSISFRRIKVPMRKKAREREKEEGRGSSIPLGGITGPIRGKLGAGGREMLFHSPHTEQRCPWREKGGKEMLFPSPLEE